ncbi:Alpha/Beta hydrolase protein [Pilobolus umbonatus]|nr:Alpha/Beta hydrolase protein [Pilobolus umbonatus]
MVMMVCDQFMRSALGRFIGQHGSKSYLSLINACDSRFFNISDGIPDIGNPQEETDDRFSTSNDSQSNAPQYSLSIAHTLSAASKLAYEDVEVVKYELEQAGFDVEKTFKPIGYKNTCSYIVGRNNDIILVFRGTNPLNIQNYVTNLSATLTDVTSSKGISLGKIHQGFWDAMGSTSRNPEDIEEFKKKSSININLGVSLTSSICSALMAIVQIVKMATFNLFANVIDPIDSSWANYIDMSELRYKSLYIQAEDFILEQFSKQEGNTKKRLYVTGHSLGGALATVFLTKMIQSDSPLLEYFEGLYTYGEPNIGDEEFSGSFTPEITKKIFNHTYNNDIIPRVPSWYDAPPGTLVYINSSYRISIYPPNSETHKAVPVRPISYLHLSGILNLSVIRRLKEETPLRILFRMILPFFVNDHFPSEYSASLRYGKIHGVIRGEEEGGKEEESTYERDNDSLHLFDDEY